MKNTFNLFIFSCFLTGCSILPGLQINANENNDKYTKLQKKENGEEIITISTPESPIKSIHVIPVNADNIIKIRSADAADKIQNPPKTPEKEYTVGIGDVINVIVWDHPELTNPTATSSVSNDPNSGRVVDAHGYMFYPYVGPIKVQGSTIGELRTRITDGLSRYIQNPQVDVRLTNYRSKRVQVSGAVNNPGLVQLDDTRKGVLEGINERGGISNTGSKRTIILSRGGTSYRMDMRQVIASQGLDANPQLQENDVVYVPDRTEDQVFVLGAVKTEGPVFLDSSRLTLTQALTNSGGLDRVLANSGGVLVFRRPTGPHADATVLKIDMGTPLGLLLAGEIDLQARDVIYVASTDFSKYNSIINQLLPTISAVFQLNSLVRNF